MSLNDIARKSQADTSSRLVVESATLAKPETSNELFDLYEKVVEAHPGSRDAEIFEKIRQWTFSDFSVPAHEFAGISKSELDAWQTRNRINLSAGQIRPDPIDLQRGYAWGHMRLAAAANRLHSDRPPPSALEVSLL